MTETNYEAVAWLEGCGSRRLIGPSDGSVTPRLLVQFIDDLASCEPMIIEQDDYSDLMRWWL
jgi:hypothetical protein